MTRVVAIALLLFVAITASGCRHQAIPTGPGAVNGVTDPARLPTAYTVSGFVLTDTQAGDVPVDGARVDTNVGGTSTTLTNGRYSITLHLTSIPRVVEFLASRWGYQTVKSSVTITGDADIDLHLTRLPRYTISGFIFEESNGVAVPVPGVQLYCDACGEYGHTFAYSDDHGIYSIEGAFEGNNTLLVKKEGYLAPVGSAPDRS